MVTRLLLLALAGCTQVVRDSASDTDSVDVVTDLAPTFEQSDEISTVMRVHWTTDDPGTSAVEYGVTAAYGRQSTDDGSTDTVHDVMVAGMKAESDVHWRARSVEERTDDL